MVITDIKEGRDKRPNIIFVDGEPLLCLYKSDLYKFDIKIDSEIQTEQIENIRKTVMLPRVRKKAMDYLLRRLNTISELKVKLSNIGYDDEIVDQVTDYLKELGYLNDADFTERYIKGAIKLKKQGAVRIKFDLIRKGIDEELIEDKMAEIICDTGEILREMIYKKLHLLKSLDEKGVNRIRSFFIRRGFKIYEINSCIKEFKNDNNEENI